MEMMGKMGKASMLCAGTVHRMGGNADVYIQADTAWLDSKVAQTNSGIHSFTLTHKKQSHMCARKICGGASRDQMKHSKRQDLWRGAIMKKISGKAGQACVLFRVCLGRFGLRITYLL